MTIFLRIAVAMIFFASVAQAVSQVGGGKAQNLSEGFTMDLPLRYSARVQIFRNDGIQLRGLPSISGIGFGHVVAATDPINIYMLQSSFPTLTTDSRQEVQDFFAQKGWDKIVVADPCVEAAQVTHLDSVSTELTWGAGNGVVIVVPNSRDGKEALSTMANSLAVLPGFCAWR